jgi:hypothetical protein
LKIDPKKYGTLRVRAQAKGDLGDHHGAVADLTEILKVDPHMPCLFCPSARQPTTLSSLHDVPRHPLPSTSAWDLGTALKKERRKKERKNERAEEEKEQQP